MFDRQLLSLLKGPADAMARRMLALGVSANQITFAGFVIGLGAGALIAFGFTLLAIVPLLLSRLFDGLDGAMARLTHTTDRGAFLDISLDFIFYALIPVAFVLLAPQENALAGVLLLAAFVGTGTSFLAYAAVAEKRGLKSAAYPMKSFYYIGGLTEGTETIACFLLMCLWSSQFAIFATIYAALCVVTTVSRIVSGYQLFGGTNS